MNEWHFPRPKLAEHYLKILDIGISTSLAVVAPRRKGKTLFVLQDIFPAAIKRKYFPVYASLWQNTNAPHEGILSALEEGINVAGNRSALKRLLTAKIKKTTLKNELLGAMEVEFADAPAKASSRDLNKLDKLLIELQEKIGKKTILLLIDEVQHLATSSTFDPLTHSLRTILDKRQGSVKSVFTGSSRHFMNLLFNESQSPFYHFVEQVPFPELGVEFVNFICTKLKKEHGISLSNKAMAKVFDELDHSPYWMMKIVSHVLTYNTGLPAAQEYVTQLLEAAEGFDRIAKRMKPIDRIVFLALSEGKSPFSKGMFAKIDCETSVKGVMSNVQRSIQRLSEQHLVSQIAKGEYVIEKPGLKKYLINKKSK